jgi:AcrR family transcriptional regulator
MASVTRHGAPHRVRRADVRSRILHATHALLRDGERFTAIPVERILADADVARSSFYAHFPDKAALLEPLVEEAVADVTACALRWWDEAPAGGAEQIEPVIADLVSAYRRHAHLLRALAEVAAYDDAVRELWRTQWIEHAEFVAVQLADQQRQGRVSAEVDVARTAQLLVQFIDASILDHIGHAGPSADLPFAAALARAAWLAAYGDASGSGQTR